MLVYGDREEEVPPQRALDRVRRDLDRVEGDGAARPGLVRHARLVAALLEAGGLAQGLADHSFRARGEVDGPCPAADAAMALAVALARRVDRSWTSGFADAGEAGPARDALAALAALDLPGCVAVRLPEGFAHYAVYPEAYALAARDVAPAPCRVVGLRSIGATLAAMVASVRDAGMPVTLRPVGHPFGRTIAAEPGYVTVGPGERVLVADEGPGLSGSSFAAAVAHLRESGVAAGRIHLLPSHSGEPGPQAGESTRALWRSVSRHVRGFDDLALGGKGRLPPAHRLEIWAADLVGAPVAPLREVSGGAWRALRYPSEAAWPPVLPWQERRKFLLETAQGSWLLKFSGLGRIGQAKLRRARALAEAGFTPEPAGLRHGFLVERWHRPAEGGEARPGPERIGTYLGFRARHFPARRGDGASSEALFAMARHNAGEALPGKLAARLDAWRPRLSALEARRRPVETDNRMHPWEWIDAGGRALKTDALDHHAAHDLVGAQDVAWDVAGAAVEFGLDENRTSRVAAAAEREGARVDPELLAFCRLAYLAFQLGAFTLAAAGAEGAERARLDARRARYARILREDLETTGAP